MIKRFLLILLVVLLSAVTVKPVFANAVGGGFSDEENSTGNTFSASTLFFSVTDNDGNSLQPPYFDISDMKPGDSQSKTIKIKKGGIEDFKYNITFNKNDGDEWFCNGLKIETKLEGTTLYNGDLSALTIDPRPTISSGGTDQWEIIISLSNSSGDLRSKSCSFDLVFKGWQTNSDGGWGFTDKHAIGNSVSTGTWEDSVAPEQNQADQSTSGTAIVEQNLNDSSLTPASDPAPDESPTPTVVQDETGSDTQTPPEQASSVDDPPTESPPAPDTQTDGGGTN